MARNRVDDCDSADRAGIGAAVAAEQIRLLLHNPADVPVNLINAAIVSVMFWNLYPVWILVPWIGLFCAVSLARALLRYRFARATHIAETAPRWGRLFTLNAFAAGCLWGLAGSVVLMTANSVDHVFIIFALGGTMAGGIVCIAAYLPAMLAFILPTILPVILALVLRGGVVPVEMSVMLTLFTAALTLTGLSLNRSIIENLRMRLGQDSLLAKLRLSEDAMTEAQEIAYLGSWKIDLNSDRHSWSKETYRIFGVDPAKFTPSMEAVLARVPLDDRPAIGKHLAEVHKGGTKHGLDHRLIMDDGKIKFVHEVARATFDAAGRAVEISGTVQDVTESRQVASELAYRDHVLRAVTAGTGILVKAESLDQGMPEALRIVGESMKVDRVLMMQESPNRMSPPTLRYFWQIPDIPTPFDLSAFRASAADLAELSAWRAQMKEGKPLIAQFATSEGPIRAMLESFQNKSTLLVPIFVGDKLWGNLALDSCGVAREWTTCEIDLMKTFGDIAGSSVVHNATRLSLDTSEERFRVLGATAADAIIMIDGAGHISYWNRAAERILGYSAEEAVGKPVHELLAPARFEEKASQGLKTFILTGFGAALGKTTELAAIRKDGTEIAIELSLSGARVGSEWQAIGILRDITKSKEAAAHALRMARFDELTGLANRSVFVGALQHAIARAKRGEVGFAVLYLDLDHFKDVNDTLGHSVGDTLLQEVSERLQLNTREADTVARFGGDEFAVVVSNAGEPADAAILAEKLISSLGKPYSIEGNNIYSGASMGIDLYGPDACDAETLLSHADIALYRAKSEGRGTYRFFTDAMDAEVRMQVSLGTELHQAFDSGQLYLEYQPQVAIDGARVIGVEALVRWRHPQRGILSPGRFIPVAEKSGIIVKLGQWVLLTACRQARAWLDAGLTPGRIAVNLSAVQFQSPIALEADIAAVLADTGFPPQLLELELTETVLMNASREHSDIIARLRKLGVMIAIDDFGTGYSSLDYLRRFPADRIKIAQTFVQHLGSMPGNASIVRATIGLARELGISVIAEGVETREQLELLKEWGCKEVQGFYFAKPLAEEDITLLLRNGGILQPAIHPPNFQPRIRC